MAEGPKDKTKAEKLFRKAALDRLSSPRRRAIDPCSANAQLAFARDECLDLRHRLRHEPGPPQ